MDGHQRKIPYIQFFGILQVVREQFDYFESEIISCVNSEKETVSLSKKFQVSQILYQLNYEMIWKEHLVTKNGNTRILQIFNCSIG